MGFIRQKKRYDLKVSFDDDIGWEKNHNLNFPLRMNGCYRDGYGFLLKKIK